MVIFLLAGFGDHATEGCAYYLTRHWQELSERFGPRQFAALLEFPPPVDPKEFRLLFSAPL